MYTNKATIQALLKAASKDETRMNLNSVFIEKERMTTCDGHRLHRVKIEDASGPVPGVLVPSADLDTFQKSMSAKDSMALAREYDDGAYKLVSGSSERAIGSVEGEFPATHHVWPKGDVDAEVYINATYLRDACDAAIKAEKDAAKAEDKPVFVSVKLRGELTPVEILGGSGIFSAVVMPARKGS